jgi:hypothetical protein
MRLCRSSTCLKVSSRSFLAWSLYLQGSWCHYTPSGVLTKLYLKHTHSFSPTHFIIQHTYSRSMQRSTMFPSLYSVAKGRSCPAKQVDDPPPSLLIKTSAPTVLQLHSTNNMFPWLAAGFRSPVWPVTKVSTHRMCKITAATTKHVFILYMNYTS